MRTGQPRLSKGPSTGTDHRSLRRSSRHRGLWRQRLAPAGCWSNISHRVDSDSDIKWAMAGRQPQDKLAGGARRHQRPRPTRRYYQGRCRRSGVARRDAGANQRGARATVEPLSALRLGACGGLRGESEPTISICAANRSGCAEMIDTHHANRLQSTRARIVYSLRRSIQFPFELGVFSCEDSKGKTRHARQSRQGQPRAQDERNLFEAAPRRASRRPLRPPRKRSQPGRDVESLRADARALTVRDGLAGNEAWFMTTTSAHGPRRSSMSTINTRNVHRSNLSDAISLWTGFRLRRNDAAGPGEKGASGGQGHRRRPAP